MSDPETPVPSPSAAPTATAVPVRRPRRIGWILGIIGAFVVGLLIGGVTGAVGGVAVGAAASGASRTVAPATDAALESTPSAVPSDEPSAAFQYSADSFTITLKTTSKQCFGSAGCNITVEPKLSVVDTSAIPADSSGSLTYEISGGTDGTVTQTIELTGTQYTQGSVVVQTSSSAKKLTAKITDVETNS